MNDFPLLGLTLLGLACVGVLSIAGYYESKQRDEEHIQCIQAGGVYVRLYRSPSLCLSPEVLKGEVK
jgi:hypothetical protein